MLSPDEFHQLISGRRRSKKADLLRLGLRCAEVPYTWAVRYRNRRYDRGAANIYRVDTPVVSIGNLTLGGTGKTPMIAWLASRYRERDLKVGIISRGYGSVGGEPNDEARELAVRLPDVPHVQDPDRVAGARRLLQSHDVDVLLLDDGFQHRRLHRDLDIVLIDALQPEGFGHVFPRGSLREPMTGLDRADVAILTRANMITTERRESIRDQMLTLSPQLIWAEAEHQATSLRDLNGVEEPLDTLQNKRAFAFCAIGNPAGFFDSLETHGCKVIQRKTFPDHHDYSESDLALLTKAISESGAEVAICTQKDLVKLPERLINGCDIRISALQIEMAITSGEAAVCKKSREVI